MVTKIRGPTKNGRIFSKWPYSIDFWPYFLQYIDYIVFFRENLMAEKDRKMAVLTALRQYNRPMTLGELLAILGETFAERTTRRWLNEMVGEGLVKRIGQKRSSRYQVMLALKLSVMMKSEFVIDRHDAISFATSLLIV